MEGSGIRASRKTVLVVRFVPSVERDGVTAINQDDWVGEALEIFGQLYGGATAFPRARGVWRDDDSGGVLVKDEPVVIHCYTTPQTSPILTTSLGLGTSVAGWGARPARAKSGS
jgi:hypothetical protein